MTLPAMYILTAADGYVTCCEATQAAAFHEATRVPLLAPIEVRHWARQRTERGELDGWMMCHTFIWNGSDATWR